MTAFFLRFLFLPSLLPNTPIYMICMIVKKATLFGQPFILTIKIYKRIFRDRFLPGEYGAADSIVYLITIACDKCLGLSASIPFFSAI